MSNDSKNKPECQTAKLFDVYVIRCKVTGMHYVGITSRSVRRRIREHKSRKGQFLDREIQRIGWDGNFDWWVVEEGVPDNLISEREKYWIKIYDSVFPKGYNRTTGGIKHFKHSEATLEQLRKLNLGKDLSGENNPMYGKHHTSETKKAMRQAHLGKKQTEEHRENNRKARLGKHPTEEARANMRKAHLGILHTEEQKAKIGKAHLGKKRTNETRAKIREKALAREAAKRAAKAAQETQETP